MTLARSSHSAASLICSLFTIIERRYLDVPTPTIKPKNLHTAFWVEAPHENCARLQDCGTKPGFR